MKTNYVLNISMRKLVCRSKVTSMNRIKKNKPQVSPDAKSVRVIRRLNLNRTYTPLKIGVIAGYILIGMYSASSSMSGILIGMMFRIAGF